MRLEFGIKYDMDNFILIYKKEKKNSHCYFIFEYFTIKMYILLYSCTLNMLEINEYKSIYEQFEIIT